MPAPPNYEITSLNELDINYKGFQYMTNMLDQKIVFRSRCEYINMEKVRNYGVDEICKRFKEWDGRFCEFEIEVPSVVSKSLPGFYFINSVGKYGFDTRTYLTKLISNELMDEGFITWTSDEDLIYKSRLYPKSYWEFERFKIWYYLHTTMEHDRPPIRMDAFLFFEKICSTRPNEIPCLISYCCIDGVLECFMIRNKNFSLKMALEVALNDVEVNDNPPRYDDVV